VVPQEAPSRPPLGPGDRENSAWPGVMLFYLTEASAAAVRN
jgi:hypothetical protein